MLRKAAIVGVAALSLSALPLESGATVSASVSRSLQGLLLTTHDLPPGWTQEHFPSLYGQHCTTPKSVTELVGPKGVGSIFARRGGEPLLVEYLAQSSNRFAPLESAISKLGTFASCSLSSNGRVLYSSTNDGVFQVPFYGDWSLGTRVHNVVRGRRSELGYLLIRKYPYLLIVAYENTGSLNVPEINSFASKALAKLLDQRAR